MSSTNGGFDLNEGDIVSQIQQRILKIKENLCETGKVLDECREGQEKFFTNYYNLKEIMGKFESMKQQVCTTPLSKYPKEHVDPKNTLTQSKVGH